MLLPNPCNFFVYFQLYFFQFRKRQLAKQRAEEKRKEEEALRIAAQEKKEQKRKIEGDIPKKFGEMIPIYMHQPTPPLPCYDCYDSDDERYTERKNIPVWASKQM